MEYYLPIQKNKIMEISGNWMQLEKNYTEVLQAQKTNAVCFVS